MLKPSSLTWSNCVCFHMQGHSHLAIHCQVDIVRSMCHLCLGCAEVFMLLQVHLEILQRSRRPCVQCTPSHTTLTIASHLRGQSLKGTWKRPPQKPMLSFHSLLATYRQESYARMLLTSCLALLLICSQQCSLPTALKPACYKCLSIL